jgi:hypothetical protein
MSGDLTNATKWTNRLAFDLALRLENSGEELDEILDRHHVTAIDLLKFNKDPVFLRKVSDFRAEIRDKGVTFRMKARSQAEELLTTSWTLIHSPDVSPAVKADLIKSTVKWAGLEPKGEIAADAAGAGVKITINLGGQELGTATLVESSAEPAEDSFAGDDGG